MILTISRDNLDEAPKWLQDEITKHDKNSEAWTFGIESKDFFEQIDEEALGMNFADVSDSLWELNPEFDTIEVDNWIEDGLSSRNWSSLVLLSVLRYRTIVNVSPELDPSDLAEVIYDGFSVRFLRDPSLVNNDTEDSLVWGPGPCPFHVNGEIVTTAYFSETEDKVKFLSRFGKAEEVYEFVKANLENFKQIVPLVSAHTWILVHDKKVFDEAIKFEDLKRAAEIAREYIDTPIPDYIGSEDISSSLRTLVERVFSDPAALPRVIVSDQPSLVSETIANTLLLPYQGIALAKHHKSEDLSDFYRDGVVHIVSSPNVYGSDAGHDTIELDKVTPRFFVVSPGGLRIEGQDYVEIKQQDMKYVAIRHNGLEPFTPFASLTIK